MLWPKYCITKVNKNVLKVLYYKSKQRCIMAKVLYYKKKLYFITKVNKDVMAKVLYYKSKQSCYGQRFVLQK